MKLSLITAAALATLTFACDETVASRAPDPRAPETEQAPEGPPPAAEPRKLVEGDALSTSPVNLLVDPGFGLAGQQASFNSFLAFVDGSFAQVDLRATFDSRSPAGFGGSVALVQADGATNKKSDPVLVLASFLGGAGPFRVQAWLSKSSVGGAPMDVPTDQAQLRVSIAEESPDGEAFDLARVPDATRVVGGRTWVLFRGVVDGPIPEGGFFVVRTGDGGGVFHLAAPEVVAQPLAEGVPTLSRASVVRATARVKSSGERIAIARFRAVPPRLTPATPRLTF